MPQLLYLVNLCHAMDEVPMGVFDDVNDACGFAHSLAWDVPHDMVKRLELPDCSTPCCITVTTFRNGTPISRVVVRDYDAENEMIA